MLVYHQGLVATEVPERKEEMARYFKIIEIDSDSFINATGEDLDCCQLVVPADDAVYVAVDDEEYEMNVDLDTFDGVGQQ